MQYVQYSFQKDHDFGNIMVLKIMKVLIPGSFDPPTNGHIDVIFQILDLRM